VFHPIRLEQHERQIPRWSLAPITFGTGGYKNFRVAVYGSPTRRCCKGEHLKMRNALTGEMSSELAPTSDPREKNRSFRDLPMGPTRTNFEIAVPPHSYMVFTTEE
jgi:hypothetical protein